MLMLVLLARQSYLYFQLTNALRFLDLQITKYVEREIMNHTSLMHPHIVQFKEVSCVPDADSF